MRSTPRYEAITLSAVTPPPLDQNNPASQWHPEGAFYLNSMQPPPKRWPAWVIVAIAVGAVLILGLTAGILAAAAPDPTPAAAPSDTDGAGQPHPWTPEARATTPKALTVKLGETLVYTAEGLGTDDEVHYTLAAGKAISKTKYGTRPEKGQFFCLVAAVNVVKGSAYVYGGDFALVTTDGTVYEANMSHAVDGGLEGVEARTGQKVSGLVVQPRPRPDPDPRPRPEPHPQPACSGGVA